MFVKNEPFSQQLCISKPVYEPVFTGCCYDFVIIKVGCIVKCFCCVVVIFYIAFEHLAALAQ